MNIASSTAEYNILLEKYNQYFEQNCTPSFQNLLWQIIINGAYDNKTAALTPIIDERTTIGVAVENEPGYYPTKVGFKPEVKYDQALDILTELNQALFGLAPKLSMSIVLSSMRKG